MRGRSFSPVISAVILLTAAAARAAVPAVEDLSGCSLPNGVVTLPAPGAAPANGAAPKADLLKFSDGSLVAPPAGENGAPLAGEALRTQVRGGNLADLRYLPEVNGDGGTFWAFSGRISDLGARYLSEAATMNAGAPMEIPGTSRAPAGMHPGLAEGHTYLVQTTEGHHALVRILEKTPDRAVIQYVYQPSGTVTFDVPAGERLPYKAGAGAAATRPAAVAGAATGAGGASAASAPGAREPGSAGGSAAAAGPRVPSTAPSLAAGTMPNRTTLGPRDVYERESGRIVLLNNGSGGPGGVEPALESLVRQRELMIQKRLAVAQAPARTPQEIERKAQAITDLATLRADEAVDVLVAQVAFFNTRGNAREFTPDVFHPAYAALKKLGKPASNAALRGLAEMKDLEAPNEGLDSPFYRAGLLMQVVRAVEGEEVAEMLVKRDMEKATDPRQRALYEHLLGRN